MVTSSSSEQILAGTKIIGVLANNCYGQTYAQVSTSQRPIGLFALLLQLVGKV